MKKALVLLVVIFIPIAVPWVAGSTTSSPAYSAGIRYELLPGSTFQEGCFPPCLCPLMVALDLKGSFLLVRKVSVAEEEVFQLKQISIDAIDTNGQVIHRITGSGTYRRSLVGEDHVRQQLVLRISIDGGQTVALKSGRVLGCSELPNIAISANSGVKCFVRKIDLIATPGPQNQRNAP